MKHNLDLRVRKGSITYKELAKVVGIHQMSLARWFNASEMDEIQRKRVLIAIEKIETKKGLKA